MQTKGPGIEATNNMFLFGGYGYNHSVSQSAMDPGFSAVGTICGLPLGNGSDSMHFHRNVVFNENPSFFSGCWRNSSAPAEVSLAPQISFQFDGNCWWAGSNNSVQLREGNVWGGAPAGPPHYESARLTWEDWQKGQDQNSVIADPMFETPPQLGPPFTLRQGSPALRVGFRQLDISKAGLLPPV